MLPLPQLLLILLLLPQLQVFHFLEALVMKFLLLLLLLYEGSAAAGILTIDAVGFHSWHRPLCNQLA
jgi:hypothetical protein